MENEELIKSINKDLAMEMPDKILFEELKNRLSDYINYLIKNNFEKLISVLYRIDVSEKKLKNILQLNAKENAGKIIAQLIIERQLQKINAKKDYDTRNTNISDDEKW